MSKQSIDNKQWREGAGDANQRPFTPEESELCANCGYAEWRHHKGTHPCKKYQPSQQPDHFTSMPDDQFKKRLKQTAEQSDELTQPWPVACEKCNGLRKEYPSTPEYGVYSQHYNYHVEPSEQSGKELDDIKLSISFTERQLDDMKPGDEIELGLTDEAKQRLNALIEKKVREARIDELEREWTAENRASKDYLIDRLAELQDNPAKED